MKSRLKHAGFLTDHLTKDGVKLVNTPTIDDIGPRDFSRLPWHVNIHENNPNLPEVPEELRTMLRIPKGKNTGLFAVAFSPTLAEKFLSKFNLNNRRLVESRTYGLSKNMCNGTFTEVWCDPIIIDTKGQMMSGQKRLTGLVMAGDRLHESYGGYVWFLVAYGVEPTRRSFEGTGEERTAKDCIRFLPDGTANKVLHTLIRMRWTWTTGQPQGNLIGNLEDRQRIFGSAKEAMTWASNLKTPTTATLDTIPVRLALVEMYLINKAKAIACADALFFNKGATQPILALRDVKDWCNKRQCMPFAACRGGSADRYYYRYVIPFFRAFLEDRDFTISAVSKTGTLSVAFCKAADEGWGDNQAQINDHWLNAVTGPVPDIKPITDHRKFKDAAPKTEGAAARIAAQKRGVVSANVGLSAIRLLQPDITPSQAAEAMASSVTAWNTVTRHSTALYYKQPEDSRLIQPSVFCAFLWLYSENFDEALMFIETPENWKRITANIQAALPVGKERLPVRKTLAYLCKAYETSRDGLPLPRYEDTELDEILAKTGDNL